MDEVWKPVVGYEGSYEVSSLGRVRSLDRVTKGRLGGPRKIKGRIMSASLRAGYLSVCLYADGFGVTTPIHRIVAAAFCHKPSNNSVINHIDGIKTNNNVSNLEWTSYRENTNHAYKNGLIKSQYGESRPLSKLKYHEVDEIRRLIIAKMPFRNIAERYGVTLMVISNIKNGKSWLRGCNLDLISLCKDTPSATTPGEGHYNAKLSETMVVAIIGDLINGVSVSEIASRYSISKSVISNINHGKTWAHVKVDGHDSTPYQARRR